MAVSILSLVFKLSIFSFSLIITGILWTTMIL